MDRFSQKKDGPSKKKRRQKKKKESTRKKREKSGCTKKDAPRNNVSIKRYRHQKRLSVSLGPFDIFSLKI